MFAREGYFLMSAATVIGILLSLAGWFINRPWSFVFYIPAALIVAFTFYFFRDPERTPPADTEDLILSPADGKVLIIEEVDEPTFFKSRALKVSIFLSPLTVHVNRIPANGIISYDRYIPGDYLVAWHPKASELNERSEIGMIHTSGSKILFKQIAGAVARRIVYYVSPGDEVVAGDRFGIVKFGSRMDILLPLGTHILVGVGDKVRGGETILGHLATGESDES
jgi:phosphatidylserine decarboxylase